MPALFRGDELRPPSQWPTQPQQPKPLNQNVKPVKPTLPVTTTGFPGSGPTMTTTQPAAGGGAQPNGGFGSLIGQQIDPVASHRLRSSQSLSDYAAQQYGMPANTQYRGPGAASPTYQQVAGPQYGDAQNAARGAAGSAGAVGFGYGGDTGKVRGMTLDQLQKTMTGPDRGQLAADSYKMLEETSRPEYDRSVRDLGRNTAALGRVGSGMYNSDLTDIATARETMLDQGRRSLATDAAGKTLDDRLAILSGARGVGSDFAGMDLNAGQLNASERNSAFNRGLSLADFNAGLSDRTYAANARERDTAYGAGRDFYGDEQYERNYRDSLDAENFGRRGEQLRTLSDYASGIEGSERRDRDETRGERDYQYQLDRDAIGDAERQYLMEEAGIDNDLRRRQQIYGMNQETGYGGNPYGVMQNASDQYQQGADSAYGGAGDLLGQYLYWQSQQKKGAA